MKGSQKNMAWRQNWENKSRNTTFVQYIGLYTDSSHFGTIFCGISENDISEIAECVRYQNRQICNVENFVTDKMTDHLYRNIYLILNVCIDTNLVAILLYNQIR